MITAEQWNELDNFKQMNFLREQIKIEKDTTIEQRLKQVTEAFNNMPDTLRPFNVVSTKQLPLSEHDRRCKYIEGVATYLIRNHAIEDAHILNGNNVKTYQQRNKELNDELNIYDEVARKPKIPLSPIEVSEEDRTPVIMQQEFIHDTWHNSKFPKFLSFEKINPIGTRQYVESLMAQQLKEYEENRQNLIKIRDTMIGEYAEIDYVENTLNKKKYINFTKLAKDMLGNLSADTKELMKSKHRYIYFNKIGATETIIDYDVDTGYFNEFNEYIEISQNKVKFDKVETYVGIIANYVELKDFNNKIETDMYHILHVFHQVLNRTKLKQYEKDILKWYTVEDRQISESTVGMEEKNDIDKFGEKKKVKSIIELLDEVHGKKYDQPAISKMLKNYIPAKMKKAYDEWYIDWLYTFKFKGEYKYCNKCKLNVLKFNFGNNPRLKSGLRSVCKKCENK